MTLFIQRRRSAMAHQGGAGFSRALTVAALVIGAASSLPVAAQSGASANAQDYYWPNHQQSLTFKAKSHAFRGTLQFEPGAEVNIGGQTYRELQISAVRLKPSDKVTYLRAGNDGLYSRYSRAEQAPEILELKLPARVGDQWQTVDRDGKPSKRSVEKVGSCQVRGRDFADCITISFEAQGMPAIAVYAPGYGEIVNSQVNGFVYRELAQKSP